MSVENPTEITALGAQAAANQFLSDHLPDRFTADLAHRDPAGGDIWRVPVILAYPVVGSIGQVGEILISADTEQGLSYTALDEMKRVASDLYEAHRERIEAHFS